MSRNLRLSAPETIGLCVVGATIGAVLSGAAVSDITLRVAVGAVAGGALLPALVMFPWSKLMTPRQVIQAAKRAEMSHYTGN